MKRARNRAQGFIEYAILIAILAGAFMAMRFYLLRSVQEKYRESADVFGEGEQYEKGKTQVTQTTANAQVRK